MYVCLCVHARRCVCVYVCVCACARALTAGGDRVALPVRRRGEQEAPWGAWIAFGSAGGGGFLSGGSAVSAGEKLSETQYGRVVKVVLMSLDRAADEAVLEVASLVEGITVIFKRALGADEDGVGASDRGVGGESQAATTSSWSLRAMLRGNTVSSSLTLDEASGARGATGATRD